MKEYLKKWLKRHFIDGSNGGTSDCGKSCTRALVVVLALWMVLWTVWPSLCIGNVSIDVSENVAWGQNFSWGYDKNPYFGAWLSYAVFKLVPLSVADYVFYFMSQLSVAVGLICVYLLARDIFERDFPAFILVPLAFLIPFFGHSACEFNDDVLCISLYGLTALFFYRGIRRNTAGTWIAAGICAGLALMTKYLAGVLLLPLGLFLLFTKEGRSCLKKPWIYLGLAIFALLVIPNVIWLCRHDFIAITYATRRADLDAVKPTVWTRICSFLAVWKDFLVRLILPVLALVIFRRGPAAVKSGFDRAFVWIVALAPTALSSLFALISGGNVLVWWTTPYYVFVTLWMVMLYRPVPGPRSVKAYTGFMAAATILMVLVFGNEFICRRTYRRRACSYNNYPGRQVADDLTAEWRRRFGTPCPYVIGDRRTSCNMCYYSTDHPTAFFDHDVRQSTWISPDEVRRKGAVVIWSHDKTPAPPKYLERYPTRIMLPDREYDRAAPAWVRRLFGRPRRPLVIHTAIIPPTP